MAKQVKSFVLDDPSVFRDTPSALIKTIQPQWDVDKTKVWVPLNFTNVMVGAANQQIFNNCLNFSMPFRSRLKKAILLAYVTSAGGVVTNHCIYQFRISTLAPDQPLTSRPIVITAGVFPSQGQLSMGGDMMSGDNEFEFDEGLLLLPLANLSCDFILNQANVANDILTLFTSFMFEKSTI